MSSDMDTISKRRPVFVLSRENYEKWFSLMSEWLIGEDLFDVVQYGLGNTTAGTPESDNSQTRTFGGLGSATTSPKANAKAKYWIQICINEDDQGLIHNKTAKEMWDTLKSKYAVILQTAGRHHLQDYVNYKMGPGARIDEAWTYLTVMGRKLAAARPDLSGLCTPTSRFQQLLQALPSNFANTKAAIDGRGTTISIEEGLALLQEREAELQESETAMFARQGKHQNSGRQTQQNSSDTLHKRTLRSDYACIICDEHHSTRDCSFLPKAKEYAARKKETRSKEKKGPTNGDKLEELRSQMAKMARALEKLQSKPLGKAYSAEEVTSRPSSSPTSDSDSSLKPTDDEEYEVAAAATEARGKHIPQDQWVLDTGATSNMTDQKGLFRKQLIPIKRVKILVGGGVLFADYMGDITLVDKFGNWILIRALFVPGLGVNLLSCRRIFEDFGLSGFVDQFSFNIVNRLNSQIFLTAQIRGGLYILDKLHPPFLQLTGQACEPLNTEVGLHSQEDLSISPRESEYILWHRRFGHLGPEYLRNVHKVATLSKKIPIVETLTCQCEVCALTKMTNRRGKTSERKAEVLSLVSIDICGPFEASRQGFTLFLIIVDSHSRKRWVIGLAKRGDAPAALRKWFMETERESDAKVKSIRSDNARELIMQIKEWNNQVGIEEQSVVPYNSIQNGLSERHIRSTENGMRARLKDSGLPNEFWIDAAQSDAYLHNRAATGPEVDGFTISPEEAYTGIRPSLDHIRVWGCVAYTYMNPKSIPNRQDKLKDRARKVIFIGYVGKTTKTWKFWAPDMKNEIQASSVRFSEEEKWGSENLGFHVQSTPNTAPIRKPLGRPRKEIESILPQPTPTAVPNVDMPKPWIFSHVEVKGLSQEEKDAYHHESDVSKPGAEFDELDLSQGQSPSAPVVLEPPTEARGSKRLREDDDINQEEPSKYQKAFLAAMSSVDEAFQEVDPQHATYLDWENQQQMYQEVMATLTTDSAFAAQVIPIPTTYKEAISDPQWGQLWKEAIEKELTALAANSTWKIVTPPGKANIVTSKWVFNTKFNTDGSLEKLKARLVARGFSQKFGVDFEDTFAPTVRHDTLRVFLAMVAVHDLECHQVDVNNAFTESFLKEDIFMKPPPGVDVPPGQALQILRSLYGLKQAARDWNQYCVSELKKLGFAQSEADPCLLIHHKRRIMILVYVDDIAVAAPILDDVNWFKKSFSNVFKIKDLGEIQKILGCRITRNRSLGTLRMDQSHFIKEVLTRYNMESDKHRPAKTPLNGYDALRPAGPDDHRSDISEYQQRVGSCMYLAILTRPDISFALGRLSQYLADPADFHMQALKGLMRYLRSTVNLGLEFSVSGSSTLIGYSDSDYAMDKETRRSILGNVFMLAGSPVSWMSKKQKSVATSTMEAEYMAMHSCAKQSQWLAHVLRDMGFSEAIGMNCHKPTIMEHDKFKDKSPIHTVSLKGDNQAALLQAKDAHTHDRSKHIDVAYHYQRELYQKNRINVEFVGTEDMVADGLTKPLVSLGFQRFVGQLGMTLEK